VLSLVDRIVRLQEAGMPAPPPRLPKAQLRDYAQLPQRAELAALTDSIAALAHGVLAMER
jgi:WASH complex subunit strumpellin